MIMTDPSGVDMATLASKEDDILDGSSGVPMDTNEQEGAFSTPTLEGAFNTPLAGKRKKGDIVNSPKFGGEPKTLACIDKLKDLVTQLEREIRGAVNNAGISKQKELARTITEKISVTSEQLTLYSNMLYNEKGVISAMFEKGANEARIKHARIGPEETRCKDCGKKYEDNERAQRILTEDILTLQAIDVSVPDGAKRAFELMMNLAGRKWKEDNYKTEMDRNLDSALKGTLVIFIKEGEDGTSPLIKKVAARYPDIDEILSGEDQIQWMDINTKIKNQVKTSRLIVVKIKPGDEKVSTTRFILELSKKEKDLKVALTEGLDWEFARKIIDLCNKKFNTTSQLVVPFNYKAGGGEIQKQAQNRKKITLKLTNKELPGGVNAVIKELKNGMVIGEGVEIEGVKKEDGKDSVEIRAKEGQDGALDRFINQVKSKVSDNAEVSVTALHTGMITLIIRNIDPTCDQQEVSKSLEEVVAGRDGSAFKLLSLRLNFRKDAQVAKVVVDRETSNLLLAKKLVKIGWIYCPVDLMIDPIQCFKCLKHGHRSNECKEKENLNGSCRRCLKTGHLARDCQNKPLCADCGGDHHTGVMACVKFKTMVNKEREIKERGQEGWEVVVRKAKGARN